MKFQKIQQLCKSSRRIVIISPEGGSVQWISDGYALYPLYGLPHLAGDSVFTLFDIPKDKRDKIYLDERECLPVHINVADCDEGEVVLYRESVELTYHGKTLIPIRGSQGVIFLEKKYLQPFTDVKDGVNLSERSFSDGRPYVVVKEGFLLVGVILPAEIASPELADLLANLGELTAISAENAEKRSKEPTQTVMSFD